MHSGNWSLISKKSHIHAIHSLFAVLCDLQSPDARLLASGAVDGQVNLFDMGTGRLLHTLSGEGFLSFWGF